jgi:hypothetical protein
MPGSKVAAAKRRLEKRTAAHNSRSNQSAQANRTSPVLNTGTPEESREDSAGLGSWL